MVARLWIVAIVVVLVASACSGTAETDTTDTPAPANGASTESDPGGGTPGGGAPSEDAGASVTSDAETSDRSYFEGNLDQYYLLGTWCDSQSLTWVFTGGEVQVGSDQASLGEPIPIEKIFSEPGATFVVNLGDQFIIEQLGQEVVFRRGSCDGSPTESLGAAGVAAPALTIDLAARAYDDVSAAEELGDGAVFVTTADDLADGVNLTLFPVADNVVSVESGIAWASIPQDDLIAVSQRIREILMEAS